MQREHDIRNALYKATQKALERGDSLMDPLRLKRAVNREMPVFTKPVSLEEIEEHFEMLHRRNELEGVTHA